LRPVYCFRIFWARFRRRMRFFRHFQRMWPRFFQTRELRFIQFALEDEAGYSPPFITTPEENASVTSEVVRRLPHSH
jgi:hypothetical protein